MSTGLQFDAETSRGLEAQYKLPHMVARRARALELATPRAGEHVLDVGCGPGFLCADLAAGVGSSGAVFGIDQSDAMLGLARARCADWPQVSLEKADATALPAADASRDLVVSTQVLEYVADVDAALREMHRVLKPGGRTLLLATDWRAVAWHSTDEARMGRLLAAWEEHLAHPALPRTLGARLEASGLCVTDVQHYAVLERARDERGYSNMLLGAIRAFAPGRCGVSEDDAQAWADEQRGLRESGDFHFSLGQYFFRAAKLGA